MKTMSKPTLYPLSVASTRAGLSKERMRQLCLSGDIEHIRDAGNRVLIAESVLNRFIARRKKQAAVRTRIRRA